MLRELLRIVESAGGAISLTELSRRLGVDAAALDGMLDFWVRKGRLRLDTASGMACAATDGDKAVGMCGSCSGATGCPFMARLPRAYRVIPLESR